MQGDQAQGWTVAVAPGMDHEAVGEGGILTCSAAERGPELLLAEGDRVIRYHGISAATMRATGSGKCTGQPGARSAICMGRARLLPGDSRRSPQDPRAVRNGSRDTPRDPLDSLSRKGSLPPCSAPAAEARSPASPSSVPPA